MDSSENIPGIFRVGVETYMVLMTGHYSDEFSTFLPKHFHSINTDFCYNKFKSFAQADNLSNVRAVCHEDEEKLSAIMKGEIETFAREDKPVIVFGKTHDINFIESIEMPYGVQRSVVVTAADVKIARKHFLERHKGVIFMDDAFVVGVDVKCGNDAAVLVYVGANPTPDREQIMQMLGRGQRSRGEYKGTFYIKYDPEKAGAIEELMKQETTFDF